MGTIFYLNDNKFEYRDNVLQQQLSCYKINEKNIYAYITPGYRDIRLRTDLINEDTYMFSRNYFFNLNHYEYLYKYLVEIMKNTKDAFLESKLTIRCNARAEIDSNLGREYKKELEEALKMLRI